jgi:pimeloyl-ACP methyl ester carboxylesterase
MRSRRLALSAVLAVLGTPGCDRSAPEAPFSVTSALGEVTTRPTPRASRPTIVLVHGAFSDATGWQELITILQRRQYPVLAVQNTLTGLDADIATTKRLLDAQQGPVIVVGHSYGGAVITGAAAGNPNVKALVYVAAFAPDANEPVGALLGNYPPVQLATALVPDAAGFLYIDRAQFRDVFAQDVPARWSRIAAVTQKPLIASAFGASTPQVAWRTIPSWYLVATEDHALNPDLERAYARRMGAQTTEVRSSHAMFVSHPEEVARVIEQAAGTTALSGR